MRHSRFTRVRALLAGGLVLGIGATMTLAAWTDQEVATTTVTAGTFALQSRTTGDPAPFEDHGTTAAQLHLNATGLYPGVSKAAWIQVKTAPDSVAGKITDVAVTGTPSDSARTADTALLSTLTTNVYPVTASNLCNADNAATNKLPFTAARSDNLEAGGTDSAMYCVVLTLPTSAGTAAQGGSVTVTVTVAGTTG